MARAKAPLTTTAARRAAVDGSLAARVAAAGVVKATVEELCARALAGVRGGQLGDALAALIDVWRAVPSPEVAAVVDRVSARVRTNPPVSGKTKDAIAAWTERVRARAPEDLPALVDALADVPSGDARARLAELPESDPRIDAALVGLLETVPYRATSTKPFWQALYARLEAVRDPALLARIASPKLFDGVAATQAQWLRTRRDKLLAMPREAPPAAPAALAAIAEALEREVPALRGDDAALLRAIHEAPDDDGPRLVYADALLERGDPRGELISLQCRGDGGQRRRVNELVAAHGKAWLGELAPILRATFQFERGFLAVCDVDTKKMELVRRLAGHPAWSTVRDLAGSATIGLHPVMRSLRRLDFSSPTAHGEERLPEAWRDLLEGSERPIEELAYRVAGPRVWDHAGQRWLEVGDDEVALLARCPALPRLRSLEVRGPIEAVVRVLEGPIAARLGSFTASVGAAPYDWLLAEGERARFATLALRCGEVHTTELALDRGERGYERARLVVGPAKRVAPNWSASLASVGVGFIQRLPPTVTAIHLTRRKNMLDEDFARVTAAAQARGMRLLDQV